MTVNPLTNARREIAAACAMILGNTIPVYAAPPTNVSVPSVVISPEAAEQTTSGLWQWAIRVIIYGPSGDNDAALEGVETILYALAPELSRNYSAAIDWEAPAMDIAAGNPYISVSFLVTVDIS